MALFKVSNERAQFDAAGNDASDQYGAGIRFTQGGNARVTTGSATNYNQGIPMSSTGQVAIVDATAGLPAGTIFHNGLPISGDKVCVSRNATAVVSNGMPYDAAGAVAADINLDLNFISTDTLNSSITFTRASTGTFTGSNGLIQSAAIDAPRFDHDPVTLAAKGLLIEEQRTNGFLYSQDFTNVYWNYTNAVTITANVTTAPDGTTTGNLVVPNAGTVNARTGRNPAGTNAVNRTYSFYVKTNGIQYITVNTSSTSYGTCFDIVNGTKIDPASGVVGTPTISNAGNGWWRVTHTTATGTIPTIIPGTTFVRKGTSDTDTFNGTDGFYIWGGQWEDTFTFATSYIPTVASQVTRSADVASVNTLSPWYNAAEGTVYAEYSIASQSLSQAIWQLTNDGSNRMAGFHSGGAPGTARFLTFIGGTAVVTTLDRTAATSAKWSSAYKAGDYGSSYNGQAALTNSYGSVIPTAVSLQIGSGIAGANTMCGHIRRITYYPRRLSNAELQALTA